MPDPQPADLLIVSGTNWASKLIEIGAILRGRDAASHVAVMHHVDKQGTPWAIEGRPGGVGWRDARDYLSDSRTVTNVGQPKTPKQRDAVCELMVRLLGTKYDWVGGIAADGAADINLPAVAQALENLGLWVAPPHGQVPGAVVCSSVAAWGYDRVGLPSPAAPSAWESVQPADWRSWIEQRHWASA